MCNSSRNCYIYKNSIYKGKHSLLTGHFPIYQGIQRDLYYVNNECYYTWHGALACHNACENLNFFNNLAYKCKYAANDRVNNTVFYNNNFIDCWAAFYIKNSCKNMKAFKNIINNCLYYIFVQEINRPYYHNERFNILFYKNYILNSNVLYRIYDKLKTLQDNYIFINDIHTNIKKKKPYLDGYFKMLIIKNILTCLNLR